MPYRRLLTLLILFAAPLLALCEAPTADKDAVRRSLDKYRADPVRFNRLRQNLEAFLALPAEKKQQLIKLDQDLREEPSYRQVRLFRTMERYAEWLERIPEGDRKSVLEAPDKATRLTRIRQLRENDWLRRQPQAVQKAFQTLKPEPFRDASTLAIMTSPNAFAGASRYLAGQPDPRVEIMLRLRAEDRQQNLDWKIAAKHWNDLQEHKPLPVRASDFNHDLKINVKFYVDEYLRPMLSKADAKRLETAEGQWPHYAYTLVELADKYPLALPSKYGPRTIKDLPTKFKDALRFDLKGGKGGKGPPGSVFSNNEINHLKNLEKKTEFGSVLATMLAKVSPQQRRVLTSGFEFQPTRISDLSPTTRVFVEERLLKVISEKEKHELYSLEGDASWPAFPELIQKLAAKYHLNPPWQTLPALPPTVPPDYWDNFRLNSPLTLEDFPDLPSHKLRDFALTELDPGKRAALKLSPGDPQSLQRLKEEYFRQREDELRFLRQKDALHPRKVEPFTKGPPMQKRGGF